MSINDKPNIMVPCSVTTLLHRLVGSPVSQKACNKVLPNCHASLLPEKACNEVFLTYMFIEWAVSQ